MGVDVPYFFDSRTHWKDFIFPIRDQLRWGSCWAFGAAEALSDRFAIASKGKIKSPLSPQYLVSWDQASAGCSGGWLNYAWNFLNHTGIPTDKCVPYTSGGGDSGTCPASCADGSKLKFYKTKNITGTKSINSLQQAIITSGPVEVTFEVYEDFYSYKSGTYSHVTGSFRGMHAVKVIGWGVDWKLNRYWIIANSWNTNWGMDGFFHMKFGACEIESNIYFGEPDLDGHLSEFYSE